MWPGRRYSNEKKEIASRSLYNEGLNYSTLHVGKHQWLAQAQFSLLLRPIRNQIWPLWSPAQLKIAPLQRHSRPRRA